MLLHTSCFTASSTHETCRPRLRLAPVHAMVARMLMDSVAIHMPTQPASALRMAPNQKKKGNAIPALPYFCRPSVAAAISDPEYDSNRSAPLPES